MSKSAFVLISKSAFIEGFAPTEDPTINQLIVDFVLSETGQAPRKKEGVAVPFSNVIDVPTGIEAKVTQAVRAACQSEGWVVPEPEEVVLAFAVRRGTA